MISAKLMLKKLSADA